MIENITMYRNLNGNNKSILSFCASQNVSENDRYVLKNEIFDINKEYFKFKFSNSIVATLQPIDTLIFQCLIAPVSYIVQSSSGNVMSSSSWELQLFGGSYNPIKTFRQNGYEPILQSYTLHNIQIDRIFQFKIGGIGAKNINPYGMFWGSFILGE